MIAARLPFALLAASLVAFLVTFAACEPEPAPAPEPATADCDVTDPCVNGSCDDTGGALECACDEGYVGDFCTACDAG